MQLLSLLTSSEISESVAEQGKKVDDYGKGVKNLGKIAVTMGGVVGWIPAKNGVKDWRMQGVNFPG